MHNWQGAIRECNHLRNATWLVAGRHEEEVTTSHHISFNLWAEACVATHTALVLNLDVLQPLRQISIAVAHENKLHTACNTIPFVLQKPVNHAILQDIDAFLPCKPSDEPNQGHGRILIQSELLLEECLAFFFPCKVCGIKVCSDELIRRRVPGVLDSVLNSCQVDAFSSANVLQQKAALGGRNLIGVILGHSQHPITCDQRALGEVDAFALVQLPCSHVLWEHMEQVVAG
mmetsp:Transcript_45737/g.74319  ORF Transcript_45737/g.74319 Transcript_45737/m.74319 type:complete len:231 (+) Transcript_45737:330-1022(+)